MPKIEFEQVSKQYRIGLGRKGLRDAIPHLFGRLIGSRNNNRSADEFIWALKDVSFEIEEGETVGLIGPNGAGKTTILKLLSNITKPTSGDIQVRGRISALIELGAGFHPDLTGRENIYLNGSILGLKRREIDALFDEIVAFAELEQFIDTPVKRYSSGMYVRLGFAIAVHAEPEILLIDEVLAVGDLRFQKRCFDRMTLLREKGVTIVLVSHHMPKVGSFCERAIFLSNGQIVKDGEVHTVIGAYEATAMEQSACSAIGAVPASYPRGGASLADVVFRDSQGLESSTFVFGDPFRIDFQYDCQDHPLDDATFFVIAYRLADGCKCFGVFSHLYGFVPEKRTGRASVLIDGHNLLPGRYVVDLQIRSRSYDAPLCTHREVYVEITYADEYIHTYLAGVYQPANVSWHDSRQ